VFGEHEDRGAPPGRDPDAVVRSALDTSDTTLCASERTQVTRGVGRRRRVLANMRREGRGILDVT